MKTILTLVFASTLVFAVGCGSDDAPTRAVDESAEPTEQSTPLVGSWTHSMEEDSFGSTTDWYRPSQSRDFAYDWFRMRYDFFADGTCEYWWLSPNDAHEMRPGTWELVEKDERYVRVYDEDGELLETVSFRIVQLEGNLLQIEPRNVR